ncbi:MAG: hypothetical protein ACE5OZ_05730 [Candidatus Heimdallarchaeota archaeon]
MFSQSSFAEESDHNTTKSASGSTRALNHIQKYQKAMKIALDYREKSFSRISPQLILRIQIRGGNQSFQTSKLPTPLRVTNQSTYLELDYLCHFDADCIDGIAREGASMIQEILGELERNGIDLECFSIFFVPLHPAEFTIIPQLL